MAFTPENYLMAERALDEIIEEATANFNQVDSALTRINQSSLRLQNMQADWGAAVSFINAEAAANPADEQWQALLARKNKLVAAFIEMRDLAMSVDAAAAAARNA